MAKQTIDKTEVAGKRVLMRVDFNVPMQEGAIQDDRRIRAVLPSIKSVLDRGGRLILMSHMGRPEGTGYDASLSLAPVAKRLGELLGTEVNFPSQDCIDDDAVAATHALANGQVLLLENLRFHKAEKTGDATFAAKLALHGDIYCNEAFGTSHRTDASMLGAPEAMDGKPRVAGLLLQQELTYLHDTLQNPERPFVAILGGAKVSEKIPAVQNMLEKADHVIVGGAMAYSFLAAIGHNVGTSRVESGMQDACKEMVEFAARDAVELHLPKDHVCSTQFDEHAGGIQVFKDNIKDGFMGLDIGPATQSEYASVIAKAKTIVWNGPMGVFEWAPFRIGTQQVADAVAEATANGATTIIGGGDTASAAEKFGVADKVSHVSTGGGASLELLSGKPFRAVDLLDEA